MKALIKWIKIRIDNLYYGKYNLQERETLIRTTFPWVNKVGEYESLNNFLITNSRADTDQLIKAIMSYYWGEVSTLTNSNNFVGIERCQWLVDFCNSLQNYSEELLSLNQKR